MTRNYVAWALAALTIVGFVLGDAYARGLIDDVSASPEADLNDSAIATAAHAAINDARAAQGVAGLTYSARINATATAHSEWMADSETLEHSARGTYACEYAGENIAYTYARGDIRVSETKVVDLNGNETRIGERLVARWLDSPEHRENILDPQFETEGIGIATATVDGRERVYATQALCG